MTTTPSVFRADELNTAQARYASFNAADRWLVICFCAEWCSVCRGFFDSFAAFSQDYGARHDNTVFLYIDIDEDESLTGDLMIEDFPAFAICRNDALVFFGVLKARGTAIEQKLQQLRHSERRLDVPKGMGELMGRLMHH
jgi:thiol-disulfide isomerase/thioredoxin